VRPSWKGIYYDGRTADRQDVTLTLEAAGVRITRADGTSLLWPIGAIRQTQGGFSREQIRLEYGSNPVEAAFVDDASFVDAMRRLFPGMNKTLRSRNHMARIAAWGVAIVIAAIAAYAWGAPILADWLARRLPPSVEESLGNGVAERMADSTQQCGDSATLADLRGVLDRIVTAAGPTPYRFRMIVARDTTINAFAAPGGFIVVNSGLLAAARTPEEFAGVLSHEVQHVLHRHSTRAILREVPLRIALATLTNGSGFESAAALAGNLGALRYRRGDESEADLDGIRLLAAAEIDRRGAVSFMRTLESQDGGGPRMVTYLSSHPRTAERVAQLQSLSDSLATKPVRPLLSDEVWARVRRACR